MNLDYGAFGVLATCVVVLGGVVAYLWRHIVLLQHQFEEREERLRQHYREVITAKEERIDRLQGELMEAFKGHGAALNEITTLLKGREKKG